MPRIERTQEPRATMVRPRSPRSAGSAAAVAPGRHAISMKKDKQQPAEDAAGRPATTKGRGRRNPEELQRLILDVATQEFSEHGFSGARIDRISKTAGTVDRMIYYYYKKKEGLYQSVLERTYQDINHAMASFECPLDDPLEGFRLLVSHNFDYHFRHPHAVRLLTNENLLRGEYLKRSSAIRRIHHPLLSITEELMQAGKRLGVIRQDADVEITLLTLLSLVFFYISNQYTTASWMQSPIMKKPHADLWVRHIGDVLIKSLQPESAAAPASAKAPTKRSRAKA